MPTPNSRHTRSRPIAATALLGSLAVVALVGCSSSKSSSGSTTTAAPTSTAAASTTTTAPPGPTTGFPTNEAAANHLLDAWKAGDRVGAAQGATADAVTTMFTVPVGSLNVRGCDAGDFDTSSCVYRLLSNEYELRLDLEKHANGWVVTFVSYSPPS